ncbi:MAG: dihydrolipoyl dehydrogenase [Candidatus Omnitrophica bacterium]|nr:dihydrolipoyl dehydrogenase [Candidatus Omnitrophota bacterium]
MANYDLVIIGAGWAGFNAAVTARDYGLKVCLIDQGHLGGTCLNYGCIPTKALLQSAKVYNLSRKSRVFGIEISDIKINFADIQARKEKLIQQLRQGMQFLLKGIDFINGKAEILSCNTIKVEDRQITTRFILIASGSKPIELQNLRFDRKRVISSDEVLNLKEIPKSFLIVGGGVIGCEFACLFSILGAKITIIEKMPQILPGEDRELAKRLENIFRKKGIDVFTNTDVYNFDIQGYDLILVCVGRMPNTDGLGLEGVGVATEKNKILIDAYLRTNIPNIYAAGDCTAKIMLAHFAAYQGCQAVENIVHPDRPKKSSESNIPNCIFTEPEVASVGLREDEAKAKGIQIRLHKFDFLGAGMARISDETEGFIKIISEANSGEILGASIIGPKATELIGILTLAVNCKIKTCQLKDTVFAHPTLSESINLALSKDYGI